MDGAQVLIGEEWRELKSLSWYRVAAVYGQEQHKAQEISYHCEIAPAQDFGRLLWATGVKRLADKAKELIFVCDGAVWIWKLVSHYFPDAIQIVDWYHACEYLTIEWTMPSIAKRATGLAAALSRALANRLLLLASRSPVLAGQSQVQLLSQKLEQPGFLMAIASIASPVCL